MRYLVFNLLQAQNTELGQFGAYGTCTLASAMETIQKSSNTTTQSITFQPGS